MAIRCRYAFHVLCTHLNMHECLSHCQPTIWNFNTRQAPLGLETMKNAFEGASFWWQLSLTTLFSNMFYTVHFWLGMVAHLLNSQSARLSDSPPLNTSSEGTPREWQPQREHAESGDNASAPVFASTDTSNSHMLKLLHRAESLVYKAWTEHVPKQSQLFSLAIVHLSDKERFLSTYLLIALSPQNWSYSGLICLSLGYR